MAKTKCQLQLSWGLTAVLLLLLGCVYPSDAVSSRFQEGRRLLKTQSMVVVSKLSSEFHCDLARFCPFCLFVVLFADTQMYTHV